MKQTENWKSLKSPVTTKIIDALYRSTYTVGKNRLHEADVAWDEESDQLSDLVHELGFHTDDGDSDDSDHDYFGEEDEDDDDD